jgi:diguanylate cyclase (GGDEF)-like protein
MSKTRFGLALVGFTTEITEELFSLVKSCHLDFGFSFHPSDDSDSDFLVQLREDYDVIVLNTIGYRTPCVEIVRAIKTHLPLTEIILISFSANHDLAVSAFRAGVRDIIQYPVDHGEFYSALERSQSYCAISKRSHSLGDVLFMVTAFADGKKFRSFSEIFGEIERFIRTKLGAFSFDVYASQKTQNAKGKAVKQIRPFWSSISGGATDSGAIGDLGDLLDKRTVRHPSSSEDFLFHNIVLGADGDQVYLGRCSFEKEKFLAGSEGIMDYFTVVIQNAFGQFLHSKASDRLSGLVYVDDVTGLYNQRKLKNDLERMMQAWEQGGESFAIIFIDIDHFKRVNDLNGHLAGSLVLVQLAKTLKKLLRESDLVYRYGGDEFIVAIGGIEENSLLPLTIARRIHEAVRKTNFSVKARQVIKLTVSVGVAWFPRDGKTPEDILLMADRMMYEAKSSGRDKVCFAQEILRGL